MKKTSIILILPLLLLSSCFVKKTKVYNISQEIEFLNEINIYNKEINNNYYLLDLRDKESYSNSHFYGFKLFDYEKSNSNDLKKAVSHLFNSDHLFLIDKDGTLVLKASKELEKLGFKKISVYIGGYEKLLEKNYHLSITKGLDDCDC